MLPVENELLEIYQKEKKDNKLTPQSAMNQRMGYIEILKGLISTDKEPEGLQSRTMQFKMDMLENGWTPEDMPMLEEFYTDVENTKDEEAKQKGLDCLEQLRNTEIETLRDRNEAIDNISEVSKGFGRGDKLKIYYHTNQAKDRKILAAEYPEDDELLREQKADFNAYHLKRKTKKSKPETDEFFESGYEHNKRFEAEKNAIRRRDKYILPQLTQEELESYKKNVVQKKIKSEMSQRDAIKNVFGDDVYDEIDAIYKGSREERTVDIHHSIGNEQLDKGDNVLEFDFAGSGFAQPRREHKGFHGKIVYEKKAKDKVKKGLEAQFGKRVTKVGDIDVSEHHLREKVTERNGNTKKRYSFPGPAADAPNKLQLPDMGSYTISKNTVLAKKIATDYLADLIEKWKQDPTAPENNKPVHINITGHSRGAVAASETVAEVSDWLSQQKGCEDFAKNVDFRLLLRDPVPGPDVLDERRRQPDLSRIPNLETTTIYTTATHKDVFGKTFRPQKTRGQERIIIGTTPHSLGLEGVDKSQMSYKDDGVAHQWGYFNAENKQYYRGSGINDLPEGVYLTDEKRNLIRVTKYSQVDNVMNLVNQHSQILIDNDQRQKDLRNVVRNWFVDNPQYISFRSDKEREKELANIDNTMAILSASKNSELAGVRECITKYSTAPEGEKKEAAKEELLNACREYARNTSAVDVKKKNELNAEKVTDNKLMNAAVDLYCVLQSEKNHQKQLERENVVVERGEDNMNLSARCGRIIDKLNAKPGRFRIHSDSDEIKTLRQKATELNDLIKQADGPATDDPKVREKMLEVYEANNAYQTKIRQNAGVSDTDKTWKPKTDMGRERYEGSLEMDGFVKEFVIDEITKRANEYEQNKLAEERAKQEREKLITDPVEKRAMKNAADKLRKAVALAAKDRSIDDVKAVEVQDQLADIIAVNMVAQAYKNVGVSKISESAFNKDVASASKDIRNRDDFIQFVNDTSAERAMNAAVVNDGKALTAMLASKRQEMIKKGPVIREENELAPVKAPKEYVK